MKDHVVPVAESTRRSLDAAPRSSCTTLSDAIHNSPRQAAQRRAVVAAFGPVIQREAVEDEELQLRSAGSDSEVARAGFSGTPAASFPHREAIERSFGAALPATAYTDAAAARACGELDAPGFTLSDKVGFASSTPSLELAAHEAAHVMQGTSGVRLHGGEGAYEDHADAVAARVVRGESAADLLARGPVAVPAVRRGRNRGHNRERKTRGSTSAEEAVQSLLRELSQLIEGADWEAMRKALYKKESHGGVKRAKQRRDGMLPDLTGLGKITTVDRFAGRMKTVQEGWPDQTLDERLQTIASAVNAELRAADVATLLSVKPSESDDEEGAFSHQSWHMELKRATLAKAELSDRDAAELCGTVLHEARHAEQAFLAARLSAGPPRQLTADEIANQHRIPDVIALEAVDMKRMGLVPPPDPELSEQMYKAWVTQGTRNQQIEDDDYRKEMKQARARAQLAWAALSKDPSESNIEEAVDARDELVAAIAEVKRRYTLYRNISYEADAHDVGDAAELAFGSL